MTDRKQAAQELKDKIDAILTKPWEHAQLELRGHPNNGQYGGQARQDYCAEVRKAVDQSVPMRMLQNNLTQILGGDATSILPSLVGDLQKMRFSPSKGGDESREYAQARDAGRIMQVIAAEVASTPLLDFTAKGPLSQRAIATKGQTALATP